MQKRHKKRGVFERLAPLAFVAGLVMLGLGLLALGLAATAPAYGPVEYHETAVVNDTGVLAYPVPVSPHMAARLEVAFRFPEAPGRALAVGCADYARILEGREPLAPAVLTAGQRGSFTTTLASSPFGGEPPREVPAEEASPTLKCPFLYAVFQWPLGNSSFEESRPEVDVAISSIFLPGAVSTIATGAALSGAALALAGAVSWGRRLNRERPIVPTDWEARAETDEGTVEALFLLVRRSEHWIKHARRYLVVAGVLGIFLWYPIVLPWAWARAVASDSGSSSFWLFPASALAVLLGLTVVWAREYLRLDRELLLWRERLARLHEREAAMLSELETGW